MSDSNTTVQDDEDTTPLAEPDLLLEIVRSLVKNHKVANVEESGKSDSIVILTITVAPEDRGKIIGKEGATLNLLQELFRKIYAIAGKRLFLELAGQDPPEEQEKKDRERANRTKVAEKPAARYNAHTHTRKRF